MLEKQLHFAFGAQLVLFFAKCAFKTFNTKSISRFIALSASVKACREQIYILLKIEH